MQGTNISLYKHEGINIKLQHTGIKSEGLRDIARGKKRKEKKRNTNLFAYQERKTLGVNSDLGKLIFRWKCLCPLTLRETKSKIRHLCSVSGL